MASRHLCEDDIRKQLGLEKPLIMGHSIHGAITTEYVKKYRAQAAGLVVIGSPAAWGNDTYTDKAAALWATASEERGAIQKENWGQLKEIDRLTGQAEAVARYNNTSPQYWYDPHYDATWLWEGMTVHSEVTEHLFTKVFADYDLFKPAAPIEISVIVMMGKYDYVVPHTRWKTAYLSIPNYILLLFEACGHTPQIEVQAQFDTNLTSWLQEQFD